MFYTDLSHKIDCNEWEMNESQNAASLEFVGMKSTSFNFWEDSQLVNFDLGYPTISSWLLLIALLWDVPWYQRWSMLMFSPDQREKLTCRNSLIRPVVMTVIRVEMNHNVVFLLVCRLTCLLWSFKLVCLRVILYHHPLIVLHLDLG